MNTFKYQNEPLNPAFLFSDNVRETNQQETN